MSLYQVVVRLARNPGHPDGDNSQGYTIVVPLDASDRLDAEEWAENRKACTVVRFKAGEERDADGLLTHKGGHWFFHYDEVSEGDDEAVFRMADHRLGVGDYVTIHESDGQTLTYRVTQRLPFHAAQHATKKKEGAHK